MSLSIQRIFGYVKRGGKMLPHWLIEGNNIQEKVLTNSVRGVEVKGGAFVVGPSGAASTKHVSRLGGHGLRNFKTDFKASVRASEQAANAAYAANGGSAFKYITNTCKKIPGEVASGWKVGARAAKIAGKPKILGSLKGVGKALGKRIPFIGTAIYALTTLPNIIKATKEGGLATGAGELLKTIGSMAGFTLGCVVGQVLCPIPFVGGLIGGLVGGAITDKILGKSYTEKKAEIEQKAQEQVLSQMQGHFDTGSTNPFAQGLTPEQQYQLAMMQQQTAR